MPASRSSCDELGPDLVVAALVLGDDAGLELHAECVVHFAVSLSTMMDFAGTSTRTDALLDARALERRGFHGLGLVEGVVRVHGGGREDGAR